MTRCMAWPRTMRSAKVSVPSAFFLMRAISPCSASIFSALLIETSSRSGEVGLTTKSTAPARMALMAASMEPCAVCTMIGRGARLWREAPQHLHAVDAGHDEIEQDEGDGAASGPSRICRACSPPWAVLVSKPRRLMVSSRMRRWAGSSSTIRTSLAMWRELNSTRTAFQVPRDRPKIGQAATNDLLGRRKSAAYG